MLPPKWVRRILVAPVAWALFVVLVAALPALMLVALVVSALGSGRRRALRVLWMVEVYLALEVVALAVLLGLWIGSGFGWGLRRPGFQRLHYSLTGRYLRILYRQ